MKAKLRPINDAGISFPGFQRISDFTATGGESVHSISVNSDTDKEYIIWSYNNSSNILYAQFNSDTGNNYGSQFIDNSGGTIGANVVVDGKFRLNTAPAVGITHVIAPSGFIKTGSTEWATHSSGTTILQKTLYMMSWNSTASVTSMKFYIASGTFSSGTRIVVYARRTQ